MADRTSASVFATVFEALAEPGELDRKAVAAKLWRAMDDYDFSPYQMYCDEALVRLGLAKNCEHCGHVVHGDDVCESEACETGR